MALKFTQVDEKWVAEFSVTDDFNLHIEREAYANQHYPNYLATRPWFAWVRYILKER